MNAPNHRTKLRATVARDTTLARDLQALRAELRG